MNENNEQMEEKQNKKDNNLDNLEPALDEKLSELEILRQSLQEHKTKAEEYYQQLLRLQADFDNYRKRVEKDKAEFVKFSNEGIMIKLLSIFDDLERAKKAIENSSDIKTLVSGINLIYKNFCDFLKKEGLKEIKSLGEILDTTKHHVVMQVEVEKGKDNQIVEELQRGYIFNDKVIRPAMVKVARRKSKQERKLEEQPDQKPEQEEKQ